MDERWIGRLRLVAYASGLLALFSLFAYLIWPGLIQSFGYCDFIECPHFCEVSEFGFRTLDAMCHTGRVVFGSLVLLFLVIAVVSFIASKLLKSKEEEKISEQPKKA